MPVFGSFSLLVMRLVFSAIAAAIGVAILRYRLYDIDLLINRTLVYGALSAAIVGVYIVVVGYLGALFRTGRGRGEPAGACAGCGAGWASRNRERRRRTGLLTSTGYRVDGPADARHRRRRGHSRDHHGASISRCRHADHVRGRRLGVRGIRAGARSQR